MELETLWGITAAVVPTAAGLGIGLMALTGRQTTAGFCFAFAGLWLGVVGFMWLIHTPTSLPYRVTAGLGIGIAVFVVVPLLIRVAWPPNDANAQGQPIQPIPGSPPVVNQGPGSAFSYGQQGGSTIGTLNVGPTKRLLSNPNTDPLKKQILSELPRDKPITVVSILGDSESTSFAIEIYEFLKSNGFKMHQSGITQAIFSGVPQGLARQDKPDGTVQFTVGVP